MAEDRPDPLAEPASWRTSREPPPGPDLSRCATVTASGTHCATPPSVIAWIGCTRGEHAGPMAYCAACFTDVSKMPLLVCSQCGGGVRFLMLTSTDGTSFKAVLDGSPPAHLWREIFPPG